MIKHGCAAIKLTLLFATVLVSLCGCAPKEVQRSKRFFWPPPPVEAKIEYLNFYFSSEDLLRGVERRLEQAILGKRKTETLIRQPYSVASDGKGRIFVGDFSENKVIVLDRVARESRDLPGMKGRPQKVLVDASGEIWALDSLTGNIYRFASDESLVQVLVLKGMTRPTSLTVDSLRKRLYVSDTPEHRISVYDYSGALLQSFGKRGSGDGEFNYPTDLDLDRDGNLYIVDSLNSRIQVLSPDGTFMRSFGERGTERGSFSTPKGIAVSPSNIVYVTDANQNKVVIFNSNGEYLLTLGGKYVYDGKDVSPGGFNFPMGIDVDANESIYIADFFNGMIHEFQYLTPEFLQLHPIREEDKFVPQKIDFEKNKSEIEGVSG